MKKKVLLIVSILLVQILLSAQSITWELIERQNPILKSMNLNEDVKQSIVNFANSSFQLSVVFNQSWQQDSWAEISKWEYPSYDEAGRATEYISYSYIDGAFMPAVKEFYEYNNGTLITITQRYTDGVWENYNRLTYSNYFEEDYDYTTVYDILIEYWEDSQWSPTSSTIISYDQNGYPESSSTERFTDGTWDPSGQAFYKYNPSGQLIEVNTQYYSNGQFINSVKTEYSYAPNGLPDVETYNSWGENEWVPYTRMDYNYDSNNLNSETYIFTPQEGTWLERSRFIYSYENGILKGYDFDIFNEGEWTQSTRLITTIDANGNITEYFYQDYANSSWINSSRFIYEYVEVTSVDGDDKSIPKSFSLSQNYPNPFNPTTTINFAIPQGGNVSLKVYDSLGREVAELVNDELSAGSYSVNFNTESSYQKLSSGIYFYRLESNNFQLTKKLMLIK